VPPQKRRRSPRSRLNPRARRALELLACNALGLTETIMFDHGFTRTMLAALFRAGLITTQRDAIRADVTTIARIEITAAGRRALEG
jgi:hypothetical protein